MKRLAFVLGIVVLGSSASPAPAGGDRRSRPLPSDRRRSYVIGAAGDIACPSNPYPQTGPDNCQHDETADQLARLTPVLALGDNQYETGSYAAYTTYYDPTWGQYLAKTNPVPGNHEYAQDPSPTPSGYFRYFGHRVKGPDRLGYYSLRRATGMRARAEGVLAFHRALLRAVLRQRGYGAPSDPANPGLGDRMHEWLKQDLAAHPGSGYACTLAYWHHPLFSFSSGSGASPGMRPCGDCCTEPMPMSC